MHVVFARITYGLALLALVSAFLGMRIATDQVFHYSVTLPGDVPGVIYQPGVATPPGMGTSSAEQFPVVVLGHGYAGNAGGVMSGLARGLARAGYAVVLPEFHGHGANRAAFPASAQLDSAPLVEDMRQAVRFARSQPQFDPERVAVGGYSMGAAVALDYASEDPSVAAVIAISGAVRPRGPYPVPNVFLVWGSAEPDVLRARFRAVGAGLAGLERLIVGQTYGETARGTGVRLSEVDGPDHLRMPISGVTLRRVVSWLEVTLGPGVRRPGPRSGGLWGFSVLGIVASLIVGWGLIGRLVPLLPRGALPAVGSPLAALATLAAALGLTLMIAFATGSAPPGGPFAFVPLATGRDLLGFFALCGGLLWVWLALRGAIRVAELRSLRTWTGAGVLVGFSYFCFGNFVQPVFNLWPGSHRLWACGLAALLALPYFATTEWLLRGVGRSGRWLPPAGKLLTLLVLWAGARVGALPFIVQLGIGAIAPAFVVMEIFAQRLARVAPAPWVPALFQAAWTGWLIGAVFPYQG